MQTPDSFTNLRNTIVQVLTTVVKKFLEDPGAMTSEIAASRPGAADARGAGEDLNALANAFQIGWECIAGREMGDNLEEILSTVHRLDAWLRDAAMKGAAHWFSIFVEKFIGPCHVGARFEHEGIMYVFHGYRERPLFLVTGPVTVKAAYYRREGGGEGMYPLDLILGVDKAGNTREASFLMSHFASESDYPQAEELIQRATGLTIDQNRLHRRIEDLGETARAMQASTPPPADRAPAVRQMVVETDGLMVQMRYDPDAEVEEKGTEGWHEAHAAVVGIPGPAQREEPKYHRRDASPEREEKSGADAHRDVALAQITVVGTYEGREGHLEKLKAEAVRRGWTPKTDTAVIGDGSDLVHKDTVKFFPGATHILDWKHAVGHLADARDLAYSAGHADGAAWLARQKGNLWEGKVDEVVRSIRYLAGTSPDPKAEEGLRREAKFFSKRKRMLNYPAFRAAGWPVGSGPVESACRYVVQERCKCSGMRWSSKGLRNVLAVRTTILNQRFDDLWAAHLARSRRAA
ncbi:MAG: hypothetical protein V2A58_15580 [Planctomycetota bacterium]